MAVSCMLPVQYRSTVSRTSMSTMRVRRAYLMLPPALSSTSTQTNRRLILVLLHVAVLLILCLVVALLLLWGDED